MLKRNAKSNLTSGLCFLTLFFIIFVMVSSSTDALESKDYSKLVEFIQCSDKERPLLAFNQYQEGIKESYNQASIEYLNEHPELINRIRNDLKGSTISWRLDSFSHRLAFVPEQREDYASLFQSYCQDVIQEILEKTGLDNPYESVNTLSSDHPEIRDDAEEIRVFLVHDLVAEYKAGYIFSNEDGKKIKIALKGSDVVKEVGSYSTHIDQIGDGVFQFTRDKFTIWQTHANNPYTALMVPGEETLHILLRPYTEQAIKMQIESDSVTDIKEVKRIADEFLALEESIVGSLVHVLIPPILEKYIGSLPESWIEEDLDTKSEFAQYSLLRQGISAVKSVGYKKAMDIYMENPMNYRELLRPSTTIERSASL